MTRPTKRARSSPSSCTVRGGNPTKQPEPWLGPLPTVPTCLGGAFWWNDNKNNKNKDSKNLFQQEWDVHQVVYLPRANPTTTVPPPSPNDSTLFTWRNVHGLFENISDADKESFCIETSAKNTKFQTSLKEPTVHAYESYFREASSDQERGGEADAAPYYCSFLVQKDESALNRLVAKLPLSTLQSMWHHEPCVWIFFGHNLDKATSPEGLQGRPEHTDSISHDGTWHYQLSGVKKWMLRPSTKLMEQWKENQPEIWKMWKNMGQDYRVTVECQEGDVLVVNTRLWFHQTILPSQTVPSVSYARDFWARSLPNDVEELCCGHGGGDMTNVDGLYATEDIEAGTILFREHDMPDCEIHRSKNNPNCEVVELEDGSGAVVSCRPIAAGEFFCIAEEDDDEEDDVEDDVEGEEGDDDVEDEDNVEGEEEDDDVEDDVEGEED